jgi:sugar transferase (PEP-CTERM system associated)
MIRLFSQYVSSKSIVLMVFEGALLTLALFCGAWIRFGGGGQGFDEYTGMPHFAPQVLAFVGILQICFYYCDLYDLSVIRRGPEQFISLLQSVGAACLLLGMLYFVFPSLLIGRGVFFISVVLVAAFVVLSRLMLDRVWQVAAPRENILILGTGQLAETVARELRNRGDLNATVVGFARVEDPTGAPARNAPDICGWPVLGFTGQLREIAERHGVSRIVVALEDRRNALPVHDLVRLRVGGMRVEEANSTVSALTGRIWLDTVRPSWFVFSDGFQRSTLTLVLKRALDLACGLIGLAVSLPAMLLIGVVVRLDSKGPAVFRQTRVGLSGKPFQLLKFRSMRTDAEAQNGAQWAVEHDPRVTRVGRFLRRYRLDELPQFLNVIRGEMSLVGPRPERPVFVEQLRQKISYYDERHSVRPGLTGWAQVQYRYGASFEDTARKLEYDLFYLKNMSILFDCVIILKTIRIVLTGFGGR